MLISYRIAYLWMESQVYPDAASTDIGPTPLQYGMLIQLLGSPSVLSLGTTVRYFFCGSRAPAPAYFWKAVVLGSVVYLVGHLVGMADLWLHETTIATKYLNPSNPVLNTSFIFNSIACNSNPNETPTAGDTIALENAIFTDYYFDWIEQAYRGNQTSVQTLQPRNHRKPATNSTASLIQLSCDMPPAFVPKETLAPSILRVKDHYRKYRLYASCSIIVFNVTAKYNGSAEESQYWSLEGAIPSSPEFTDIVLDAHNHNAASDHIAMNIKSRAMKSQTDHEIATFLGQEVSRLALGMSAGIFESSKAKNVVKRNPILVGRYKLAPFLALVLLLFIYGVIAFIVFLMSFNMRSGTIAIPHDLRVPESAEREKCKSVSILELVQFRLSSPIPTVMQLLSPPIKSLHNPIPSDPDAQSVSRSVGRLISTETDPSECTERRVRLEIEETTVRPRFGAWGDEVIIVKSNSTNPL
ncbi:hypothetical protein RhiXN_11915 [Rhizoctonia solani]|uniref:Uncharacterized protein n=2 Tax=Rhizoctonia solani TaxID=456999 RepID=A0A8H8P667_9AGAM|nr:uncharacterized protein RhiXN_11915 [Rhizoctonia solani]QRW26254.1 hypothetical protein RhiXN_11915 [Rhizoctonia solani]